MRFPLILVLLCSLSTSLAGAAQSTHAASGKNKAAKTTAAQGQASGTDPCADAAKCTGKFVANQALGDDSYKTYRPASVLSALARASTSARGTSHKTTSAPAASVTPKKSHATNATPKKSHAATSTPKKTHATTSTPKKSQAATPTPKKNQAATPTPKKNQAATPTPKKSKAAAPTPKKNHARRAEDASEISVTSSDTKPTTADSSELLRRHARDWSLTKRVPNWHGTRVLEGGLEFVWPDHYIYTQRLISCTAVLAENDHGTVLHHMVCANSDDITNHWGSVNTQYANFHNLVTQRLGQANINFWVSMPDQADTGYAEAQPVLQALRNDFPPQNGNALYTTTRVHAADHGTSPYQYTVVYGGLAWQPLEQDKVQYSQLVVEYSLHPVTGEDLPGFPRASEPQYRPMVQQW